MLNFAISKENPNLVKTYIDQRYGTGSYLTNLGFLEKRTNLSFRWTNYEKTFHRLVARGNKGYELGMAKIWDCGQKLFIKEIKRTDANTKEIC